MLSKTNIYADHAATTPLLQEVLEAMLPFMGESFGNPSSLHGRGVRARRAVESARETIGECIGANADEIHFTSGGTESDNWALFGVARAMRGKGRRIVVSAIEHHAVLNTCKELEENGFNVTYLPVTSEGRIVPSVLENALRKDTVLVSIMLANNEIGTIQDIKTLTKIAHRHGAIFHTDAVQAVGHIDVDVNDLGVDMLSASAHKFNGPQGVGFLYVKHGTEIRPFHLGGQQEHGHRAGTENVAGIVGMATALACNVKQLEAEGARMRLLLGRLKTLLLQGFPEAVFNGDADNRLPGLLSVSFAGYNGEAMLHILDLKGLVGDCQHLH